LEVENAALQQELGALEARVWALEQQPGASEARPDDRLSLGLLASGLLLGLVVVARNGLLRR
jgi:hypothetical protein